MSEQSMTLPEAHKLFREYFPGLQFNDFMDPTLTLITRTPKIDPFKLDDFLHEKYGNYESRNMSMVELLEKEYGRQVRVFIEWLL